jgi:hypothetical protein
LGLLASITLEIIPFCAYALFSVLLPIFKCILEVMFCEGVSTAYDPACITSVVSKWRLFSFIFNRRNRKVRSVGDNSHDVFGKKFPSEKASVRWCIVISVTLFPRLSQNLM